MKELYTHNVSDIPANREVALEDSRYFKSGDMDGMAEKIRAFLLRPLTAEEKSSQIKQVAGKYNWDTIAAETLGGLQEASDFLTKINFLAGDRAGIERMGRNARRLVEAELNSEQHYSRLMDIYQQAMEERKPSA